MKVSLIKRQLPSLFVFALLTVACGSKKTGLSENVLPTNALDGFRAHLLSIPAPKSESADQPVKIEIIPGKTMEVDCNRHFLTGEFAQKELSDGNLYYVYESNGQAVSTLMACPDNSKHTEFVQGKSFIVDKNDAIPSVVYTSEGIEVKYRSWNASTLYDMSKNSNHTFETEATKALEAYPKALDGYDRYILFLPEIKNSQKERKVEIIPGVTEETDCNQHRLMGSFVEKTIDGWGYNYLVFESNGAIRSTKMACPDNTKKKDLVTGDTHLMNYNSRLPIVVFIPKKENFSLQYRIWEAGELK